MRLKVSLREDLPEYANTFAKDLYPIFEKSEKELKAVKARVEELSQDRNNEKERDLLNTSKSIHGLNKRDWANISRSIQGAIQLQTHRRGLAQNRHWR